MVNIDKINTMQEELYYKNRNIENLPNEEWMDVAGFDGIYSVSNMGRVRSEKREVMCGNGVRIKPATIMSQSASNSKTHKHAPSLHVSFGLNKKITTHLVSTLVGESFVGELKEGECYSKKNKIWDDCRASNLEIKSFHETMLLAYRKGNNQRFKDVLKAKQKPIYGYKRLSDGVVLVKSELDKLYGEGSISNIRKATKNGMTAYKEKWEKIIL